MREYQEIETSPTYAFSKAVKEERVTHQQVSEAQDSVKIAEVIEKLESLPKVTKSRLDELHLATNPKRWVRALMRGYPREVNLEDMECLLTDFTDAMKTRMREESKYAIGLLMRNRLVLCHSLFGEETITPQWKTIPRMLDIDNVLRFVSMSDEKGIISVRYWEKEATSSFIEWLGLPQKAAFLFGGKYRVYAEIEDVTVELQLDEQEMEAWLKQHDEFREGKIRLATPIEFLNVNEVRVGRKRYENTGDFMQDYEAESYGVPFYQKQYARVNAEALPLLTKYYDEKYQLVRVEGQEKTVEVAKSTPHFDILFVNEHIALRESYLSDLAKRFINGEPMQVYHAGGKFRAPAFSVGALKIYCELEYDSLALELANYYNLTNLQDRTLKALLQYAVLNRLADTNRERPVGRFFAALCDAVGDSILLEGKWTKPEDGVLEYKSGTFVAGEDREVIERLSKDVDKKLRGALCKVFVIGVEDDGTVDALPASRLKSDRLEAIQRGLRNELETTDVYALRLVQKEGAIMLVLAMKH